MVMKKRIRASFQEAIETVEALSPEDQEELIDLIRRRLLERRRAEIARQAEEIKERRAQYGDVEDLTSVKKTSTFQAALEMVDRLTLEEKEMLFEIAYHRFIKQRRARLAEEVAEARQAYQRGEVHRGTLDDLLAELAE